MLISNIVIFRTEDSNDANSDLNNVAQNNNQHSCLDGILSRKKRQIEHILTFNGSAEIV